LYLASKKYNFWRILMSNPLKQYFRRPALHFTLPSKGRFYPDKALEMTETGELPVYPMTAIDEITSKTPDALFNGSATVDIIKSCVPAIKDPWEIPSIDIDAILIVIRSATHGSNFDIESTCTSCKETSEYVVDLMNILMAIQATGFFEDLDLGELKIQFKPLTYRQINTGNLVQFDMQREIASLESIEDFTERSKKSGETMKKLTNLNIEFLANSIKAIVTPTESVSDTNFILEFLRNCDRSTHDLIREKIVKLREDSSAKPQRMRCVHCSHEYDQQIALNLSDFFA
jgi:hypothetical protein